MPATSMAITCGTQRGGWSFTCGQDFIFVEVAAEFGQPRIWFQGVGQGEVYSRFYVLESFSAHLHKGERCETVKRVREVCRCVYTKSACTHVRIHRCATHACVYIHMYVDMHAHTQSKTKSTHTCTHMCVRACMYVSVSVPVSVCCQCIRVHACACVCM